MNTNITQLTESERVQLNRADQFKALGFDYPHALELALSPHADLAEARKLHKAGCPLPTLFRIVA